MEKVEKIVGYVGDTRKYYDFSGLFIREDNYYIPVSYCFYDDTGEEIPGSYKNNAVAIFPEVSFNEETNFWEISFDSADFGEYDVSRFTYYFKSKEELIKALGLEN
jgi:hypothetical protein